MIPSPPICILYSQDADLVRRVKAFLSALAQMRHVSSPDRLDAVLQQNSPAILVLDLRAKEARDLLEQIQTALPEILVIALGTLRSEPLREVEHSGVYAAEDLQIDRRRLQALVTRGFDHLRVVQENRDLRDHALVPYAPPEPPRRSELSLERRDSAMPLLRFPRVFRRFDNVEALLANVVESVADATGIGRVGIFSKIRQGDRYRLRAGLRCLPETLEIEYSERDGLVRWFELHAHLIHRANLPHVDPAQRAIMRRALDTLAAEVVVPLHAGGRIIGWIFFGHRVTGQRFEASDLEGLMALGEHVSTVLENALLNEEVTLQKTLAETLLKSIPPGIVATDEEANIRWFNPTAEQILGVDASDALNQPVEAVGGRLAAFLRETLEARENLPPRQWIDPNTRRSLSVETRRLVDQKTSLGAVAVVHDLTAEDNLRQKQDLMDRAAFWTDLAASMSHEIRNPLVAIKTFAQLLPERFEDADFRKDFNEIVV
ncbi:MAG TPA: histidine kinase dimerization/phospho-acceptor domain-containing protein, partial [Chthoniobacterales bacterium]|nr:histidine kinase dimerization/phospho-acceptor domain-containing protein [Chthoniobacterales bacterium]